MLKSKNREVEKDWRFSVSRVRAWWRNFVRDFGLPDELKS